MASLAVQRELVDRPQLLSRAIALVTFSQYLGTVLGLTAAGAIFQSVYEKNTSGCMLRSQRLRELTDASFLAAISPDILQSVDKFRTSQLTPDQIASIVSAYVGALRYVFVLAAPIGMQLAVISMRRLAENLPAALSSAAACCIPNRQLKSAAAQE